MLELEEGVHYMPIDAENTEEYEEHKAHENEEGGQVPVHVVGKVDVDNVNCDHDEWAKWQKLLGEVGEG